MKKLMIAVCAVALAGAVQAAGFNWSNSFGLNAMGQGGGSGELYGGKIYFMDSSVMAASDFFAAMYAGDMSETTFNSLVGSALNYATLDGYEMKSPNTGTINDGAIFFSPAGYTKGVAYDVYQVALDKVAGGLYISESFDNTMDPIPDVGGAGVDFMNDAAYAGTVFKDVSTYQGAGWYQTVPEPTSGLLLLLGVAGLALRRRRA